ncbi:MAG: hypothetical protein A3G20_05965 [Acidobacteria bacterium RIFCSPLOWO2_12_FULL_59_11]|nr:MAG: hypothetical protein A3G20_05965 [Acidobacteria bacterium RIFCSPLOWO2_12_FULL_59_11]OFW26114.1 MAG: hypothetical protein A3H27_12425 [Acidobacteria bacterium RIFCSPLOWO2_02_FULL_59_13]
MKINSRIAFVAVVAGLAVTLYSLPSVGQQGTSREAASTAGAKARPLPKDVDPASMGRLPLVKRESLDDEGKRVWDHLATGYEARGDTSLRFRNGFGGPWNVRMYDPHILEHTYEMRFYLERENTFGEELAKVAMMMAAREVNGVGSVFVYTNMEPGARRQGIKPEIIDIIKYRKPIAGISEKEAAIIQFGRELLGPGPVTPETFAHVRKLFGDKGIVQMTELISQYVVLGLVTKAFDMQNSPEQEAVRSEVAKVFGHE